MEKEYGWKASRLEYGPGLPVAYFEEEEDSGEELLTRLASELDAVDFDGRVVLEMGGLSPLPAEATSPALRI